MTDPAVLIPFLTASVLLTLMPGPDIIYVIVLSISRGAKYGIVTALGLVSGLIVHTTYIALGVAVLIKSSDELFWVIKIFGALYMLYLAYKTYKSSEKIEIEGVQAGTKSLRELYKQGFIMNVLNPKVVLFFLAFFPGFVVREAGHITLQIYILGFLFMFQAMLVFSAVAVLSSSVTGFLRNNKKFDGFLKWFQILVFMLIAFFILYAEK